MEINVLIQKDHLQNKVSALKVGTHIYNIANGDCESGSTTRRMFSLVSHHRLNQEEISRFEMMFVKLCFVVLGGHHKEM